MPSFEDLNFKYLDARSELLYSPDQLEQYYVDVGYRAQEILNPAKYILYGAKGSGKTALGAYLELQGKREPTWFVRLDEYDDFDFSCMGDYNTGSHHNISSWRLFLSFRLLTLMLEDEALVSKNPELSTLSDDLSKFGIIPTCSVSSLARETLDNSFTGKFKFFIDISGNKKKSKELNLKSPGQLAEVINEYWKMIKATGNKYILILDGLDHIVRTGFDNIISISDIIRAAKVINETLFKNQIDAKIILLLRDDILRVIPDPDLAKRLQDNGLFLEWYQRVSQYFDTNLFKLIKKRAEVAGYTSNIKEYWAQWFPNKIKGRYSPQYFIERTRYLPRDLIGFFHVLQQEDGSAPFNEESIINCEKIYSEWLFDELYDALAGLVPQEVRESLGSIFVELGRYFHIIDLQRSIDKRGLNSVIDADRLANILYDTHWIGNFWKTDVGRNIYVFKSRSRSTGFTGNELCVLQLGLIKGLNMSLSYKGYLVK